MVNPDAFRLLLSLEISLPTRSILLEQKKTIKSFIILRKRASNAVMLQLHSSISPQLKWNPETLVTPVIFW